MHPEGLARGRGGRGLADKTAPLGKCFLLLVKNNGLFIFVRHMGSYPVFSWVDLGQFAPPQGTCAPSADIWSALPSAGAGRVSSESTAPRAGRPPGRWAHSTREARVRRAEAGAGQWFRARAPPVPRAPHGRERGPAGSRTPRLRPVSLPSPRCHPECSGASEGQAGVNGTAACRPASPRDLGPATARCSPRSRGSCPAQRHLRAKQARRACRMHTRQMWVWPSPRHRLQWRPPPGSPRDGLLTPGPEGPRGPWSSLSLTCPWGEWELPGGRGCRNGAGEGDVHLAPACGECGHTPRTAAVPSGASG